MTSASSATLHFTSGATPPGAMPGRQDDRLDEALAATVVLVIEDETMIAWMLETLLEDMGFRTIMLAASAEEALTIAAKRRPGLVISDINLGGGLDGVEAVTALHATGALPTLFVSGHVNEDARARIERSVPRAAVLRKPVQPEELRTTIVAALRPTH